MPRARWPRRQPKRPTPEPHTGRLQDGIELARPAQPTLAPERLAHSRSCLRRRYECDVTALDGQTLAAFPASGPQHLAPSLRGHPSPEAVPTLALDYAWLIRPLHLAAPLTRSAGHRDGWRFYAPEAVVCQRIRCRSSKDRSRSRGNVLQWMTASAYGCDRRCRTRAPVQLLCASGVHVVESFAAGRPGGGTIKDDAGLPTAYAHCPPQVAEKCVRGAPSIVGNVSA